MCNLTLLTLLTVVIVIFCSIYLLIFTVFVFQFFVLLQYHKDQETRPAEESKQDDSRISSSASPRRKSFFASVSVLLSFLSSDYSETCVKQPLNYVVS